MGRRDTSRNESLRRSDAQYGVDKKMRREGLFQFKVVGILSVLSGRFHEKALPANSLDAARVSSRTFRGAFDSFKAGAKISCSTYKVSV